jgi:hypothetical protein
MYFPELSVSMDRNLARIQVGDIVAVFGRGCVHDGLYVGRRGFDGRDIVHNDKSRGVVLETLEEFSGGRPVSLKRRVAKNHFEQEAIAQRAFALIGQNYDLMTFNCEHAANFAQGGRRESPQLQAAFVLLGFVAVAAFASRE